ncbi:hypothetical protein OUZ56_010675 [Daphnia magna]|uniref:Uncharacterized protein n=1 Tax=Daphnia magna TaxID=35525 RepID=A0ABR0AJ86_9CRUS|nr:hypothetical protein OUZ56_010675 [Daphnia magna]
MDDSSCKLAAWSWEVSAVRRIVIAPSSQFDAYVIVCDARYYLSEDTGCFTPGTAVTGKVTLST